ncbi:nuclease SbcCD subunit C [Mycetomoellerius zeteki]|uniref:nuclease SbcCD subunit C n=1 Tax=Mycetomoellerius zeteki TaxID=64791 RepID=UPI00084ECF73|nr:PREDICTED: nuclease SbcCD subunit C-like [Trachymyrmex zeteki]
MQQEEKAHPSTQSGGKFIDTLIAQWVNQTGNNDGLQQTEEQVNEGSRTHDNKQQNLQNKDRIIQNLRRKLKESQEAQASLSASLEIDVRNKEEIQTKLSATWTYIENITEYLNYIRESLVSFQQHRVSLSTLYDDVILKQREATQKLQQNAAKSKDMENCITKLKNELQLQEERLQEVLAELNKLRKQLENSENKLQSQRNELANKHAEEKLTFVKEQQRLLSECENLQSRLQMIEKEKCDIAKSAAQVENKLLLQEEKMQEALMEQKKWQKQVNDAEREFHSQKDELVSAHAKEKTLFIEEQQRLESKLKSLQSQLNTLEQDKINITEMIAQKDTLISKLQNEISMYKNEIEVIMARYNQRCAESEALLKRQNMLENELRTKTEKIQNLEMILSSLKLRETGFVNDVNRIEKKLSSEIDYSKNLENKLSNVQKDLQLSQKQYAEMQEILEKTKNTNEFSINTLQQQLKTLQKEKEVVKRENTKVKVSTMGLFDSDEDKSLSQTLTRTALTKKQSQDKQEVVPSTGKKFFKSRPTQPRTYTKRRED